MSWSRSAALALLSLTVPPAMPSPRATPLPPGETTIKGPIAASWTHRTARLSAVQVRLNGLGARTHANWVLFRLPFDANQKDRIRSLRFAPDAAWRTDVGALRVGSVCAEIPPSGTVRSWAIYTASGIGRTERFAWHPAPPTSDPTIVGINVPTRVANFSACGWDDGRLRDPQTWTLEVSWDER